MLSCHRQKLCLFLATVVAILCRSSSAIPHFIIKNGGNKCMKVDVVRDMILLVDYDAPDLVVDPRRLAGADGDEEVEYGRGRKRKTKYAMPDMMIQMNHLLDDNGRRRSAGTNKNGTRKLREDLQAKEGRLEFLSGERDGYIEICVQAYTATRTSPRRIGLRIEKMPVAEYERQKEGIKESKSDEVKVPGDIQSEMLVKVETSRITTELGRLKVRCADLGNSASTAKKRETEFHQTSVNLSNAARYYPIFRIAILLVAGYMQASHVVQYMKTRHIY